MSFPASTRHFLFVPALVVSAVAACGEVAPSTEAPDAATETPDGPDAPISPPSCGAEVSDFIYFVAHKGNSGGLTLYKFAPKTLQLSEVAPLSCADLDGSYASVTVDRHSNLWLVPSSGAVYRAPLTGGACTPVAGADLEPIADYSVGSVAFLAEAAGSDVESLYSISARTTQQATQFRRTTPTTLATEPIVSLNPAQSPIAVSTTSGRTPIISGTGDGRLFSLSLPDGNASQTLLAQIDRTTGLQTGTPRRFASEFAGSHNAAFAFWGGDFWVFTHHQASANTNYYLQLVVTRYRMSTMTASVVATFDDIRPLGAGVSTCAPVVIL
jgi:hypothetical protein